MRIWAEHYRRIASKSADKYLHVLDSGEHRQAEGLMPDKIIIHSTNVKDDVWTALVRRGNQYNAGIYNESYI